MFVTLLVISVPCVFVSVCVIRSSLPEVFCKKGVLSNFTKFTGKHLRQSLFFNKVAGLRPATLLKKRLWHRCLPVNFAKFLRTPISIERLRWLLLCYRMRGLEKECHPCQTFSKFDVLLHKTPSSKVLLITKYQRLDKFMSKISLSKITH